VKNEISLGRNLQYVILENVVGLNTCKEVRERPHTCCGEMNNVNHSMHASLRVPYV
jgi:hypothetical protein